MSRNLVDNALRMATDARQPTEPLIHHSDRGSQYSNDDFRDEPAKNGISPTAHSIDPSQFLMQTIA